MKREQFHIPGSLLVEYQEHREGPTPIFVAWRPDTAQSFTERKPLLKFCRWPASTPTGRELRDWIDLQLKITVPQAESTIEPNDTTKVIT
jgi:hypothetical protein